MDSRKGSRRKSEDGETEIGGKAEENAERPTSNGRRERSEAGGQKSEVERPHAGLVRSSFVAALDSS
jgi:hypothetical protein